MVALHPVRGQRKDSQHVQIFVAIATVFRGGFVSTDHRTGNSLQHLMHRNVGFRGFAWDLRLLLHAVHRDGGLVWSSDRVTAEWDDLCGTIDALRIWGRWRD